MVMQVDKSEQADAPDPAWVTKLFDIVGDSLTWQSAPGDLGYRWNEEVDGKLVTRWIKIYPMPIELHGGEHDGEIVTPFFTLHLYPITDAFKQESEITWNVVHPDAGITVEGEFDGVDTVLDILAEAPKDVLPIK